ncbi:TPA: S8 family serine peptidase [Bacillus cereus]
MTLQNTNRASSISDEITHLISINQDQTIGLLGVNSWDEYLKNHGIEVVKEVRGMESLTTLGAGQDAEKIFVGKIDPAKLTELQRNPPLGIEIAKNEILHYGEKSNYSTIELLSTEEGVAQKFQFRVLGEGDTPLKNAKIILTLINGYKFEGQTNEDGLTEIEVKINNLKNIINIRVTVPNNYWDFYLKLPALSTTQTNQVRMVSLAESIKGFPKEFCFGWGQSLMGLDKLPIDKRTGAGVKIAIIDSGCDTSHPSLSHIKIGKDFTDNPDSTWNSDSIGHGTHCAGIIAAKGYEENPFSGFAPDAEIHILKIFPNGQYDNVIAALKYCREKNIDIVNMSLGGSPEINSVLEKEIQLSVDSGIACIAAAGNSGGAVLYPASSPNTLAVAAVGDYKQLQPKTWEATTKQDGFMASDGVFLPDFTCLGPEVDVYAPGVGIVSTFPGGAYKPDSGTSMAAPHVSGLAALLLAHHTLFQNQFRERNRERVAALFNLIRSHSAIHSFRS